MSGKEKMEMGHDSRDPTISSNLPASTLCFLITSTHSSPSSSSSKVSSASLRNASIMLKSPPSLPRLPAQYRTCVSKLSLLLLSFTFGRYFLNVSSSMPTNVKGNVPNALGNGFNGSSSAISLPIPFNKLSSWEFAAGGKILLYIEIIAKLCSRKISIYRFRYLSVCCPPSHLLLSFPTSALPDPVSCSRNVS